MRLRLPPEARWRRRPQAGAVRNRPNRLGVWRTGSSAGIAARRRSSGAWLEEFVERAGDRRAGRAQFVVALTQPLVGRQTRKKRGSAAFVEFVVDQSDKFGVFVSHRLA